MMVSVLVGTALNNMNKIINFLSLKNILLIIITSILAMFITMIGVLHYLMGTLSWGMFIAFLMIITIPFIIAHGVPNLPIVSLLREIHKLNEEQYIEREGKEIYLFHTPNIKHYPKKILRFLRGDF